MTAAEHARTADKALLRASAVADMAEALQIVQGAQGHALVALALAATQHHEADVDQLRRELADEMEIRAQLERQVKELGGDV